MVRFLSGKRERQNIAFNLGENHIRPGKAVKYLGVTLGENLGFGLHVNEAVKKASEKMTKLSQIIPNTHGPKTAKRRLMYGVVQFTLLYAAPIWSEVLRIQTYRNLLVKTQRKALLRVACAYRTVSTAAVQVLTAIPTIDLEVETRGPTCTI